MKNCSRSFRCVAGVSDPKQAWGLLRMAANKISYNSVDAELLECPSCGSVYQLG
jgi:hypothetical protein